jgi:TetR/AcrR family transcriptional repressor of nem operon
MARSMKEEAFSARRNEILDSARRLVYSKGYEQMTIQDILDDLQISKGAFYHYFGSKGAVLNALVERMVTDEVLPLVLPIVHAPDLSAIEKLERYFDTSFRWKTAQKTFMLRLLRVWLADENAIVRQKMFSTSVKHVTPALAEIIRQGVEEGVFTTEHPEQVSHAIIYIIQGLGDTIIDLFISEEIHPDPGNIEKTVMQYTQALSDAIERVLGAPSGSLKLIDTEALKEWFIPSEEATPSSAMAVA